MPIRVYRFGADEPQGEDYDKVIAQLRAAHDYANELTAAERGRRDAIRALYDADEAVQDAVANLRQATKSDRKAARTTLAAVRRAVIIAHRERVEEINRLRHDLQIGARELARCYWGTYLGIEAAADQARQSNLYQDDMLTPLNPKFLRWNDWPLNEGQIGVQIQRPTTTADIFADRSTYVRVKTGHHTSRPDPKGRWKSLFLCVGREGREPVFAHVRVRWHREIPDNARWKWVRLSCRREGLRVQWSVEITVDDPAPVARSLDSNLSGTIALAWSWATLPSGDVEVATWADTNGKRGDIILPATLVKALKKPHDLRAVRDIEWNETVPRLRRLLQAVPGGPKWFRDAVATIHLWKSLTRVRAFHRQWMESFPVADSKEADLAWRMLDAWAKRDDHLERYESSVRNQLLNERREWYRLHAAWMARTYKKAILSNHRLDREARFGEDSDVRFLVAPDQLRSAIKNAFADDVIEGKWDREDDWLGRACTANLRGEPEMFVQPKVRTSNAWAKRKETKKEKETAA